jgi:hypothetical protein
MKWSSDMIDKENELLAKLVAFRIFKIHGVEQLNKLYPEKLEFCQANEDKTFSQLWKELITAYDTPNK